jgi:hypothetical protein
MTYARSINSKQAFESITASGVLSARRLETYQGLYEHGPMTARELDKLLGRTGLWKRCSELESMGLVRAVETRECSVTGQAATVWDVTDVAKAQPYKKPEVQKRKLYVVLNQHGTGAASFNRQDILDYKEATTEDEVLTMDTIDVPPDFCSK